MCNPFLSVYYKYLPCLRLYLCAFQALEHSHEPRRCEKLECYYCCWRCCCWVVLLLLLTLLLLLLVSAIKNIHTHTHTDRDKEQSAIDKSAIGNQQIEPTTSLFNACICLYVFTFTLYLCMCVCVHHLNNCQSGKCIFQLRRQSPC